MTSGESPRANNSYESFLGDYKYSDLIIQTKRHKLFAHRVILAHKSEWFRDLFDNDYIYFLKRRTLYLEHEDAFSVYAMLEFIYRSHVPPYLDGLSSREYVRYWDLAERYGVESFKDYILTKCLRHKISDEEWEINDYLGGVTEMFNTSSVMETRAGRGLKEAWLGLGTKHWDKIKDSSQLQELRDQLTYSHEAQLLHFLRGDDLVLDAELRAERRQMAKWTQMEAYRRAAAAAQAHDENSPVVLVESEKEEWTASGDVSTQAQLERAAREYEAAKPRRRPLTYRAVKNKVQRMKNRVELGKWDLRPDWSSLTVVDWFPPGREEGHAVIEPVDPRAREIE